MKIIISTNESFNIPRDNIFINIFLIFILLIKHRQNNHLLTKTDIDENAQIVLSD